MDACAQSATTTILSLELFHRTYEGGPMRVDSERMQTNPNTLAKKQE